MLESQIEDPTIKNFTNHPQAQKGQSQVQTLRNTPTEGNDIGVLGFIF